MVSSTTPERLEAAPSRRLQQARASRPLVFDVRSHDQVGSTNVELRALAEAGAAHGTVICAARQTAGMGRLGRSWISPPGNLHASILLRPAVPARRSAELGFIAALAVADAVDAVLPPGTGASLKWPNDVLLDGAKVAGLLLERLEADGAVIVGIGLNVAHAPLVAAPRLDAPRFDETVAAYAVTCLDDHAAPAQPVAAVLDRVLAALAVRWADWLQHGFGPVRAAWLQRGPGPGAVLRVSSPQGHVHGRFQDLADDGALVLQVGNGTRRFVAGDVAAIPG